MVKATIAQPDGGVLLLIALSEVDLDTLASGGGKEIDLAEFQLDGRAITKIALMAKPTDADIREELAPLLAKAGDAGEAT